MTEKTGGKMLSVWGRLSIAFILLLVSLAGNLAGGEGVAAAHAPGSLISNLSRSTDYSHSPALAADAAGNVHLFWGEQGQGNTGERLLYRRWDGSTWSAAVSLYESETQTWFNPAAAADGGGNVHLVWNSRDQNSGNYNISYRRWDGTTWSATTTLSGAQPYAYEPAVAADSQGNIHVVWQEWSQTASNSEIFYRKWDGSAWSATINLSNSAGNNNWGPSLTTGNAGRVHVVWTEQVGSGVWGSDVFYTQWDGSSWSAPANLSHVSQRNFAWNWSPSVASSPDGAIHVSWGEGSSEGSNLFYRRWDGLSWSAVANLSADVTGYWAETSTLVADSLGRVHVIWSAWLGPKSSEVLYRQWTGTGWSAATNLSLSPGQSWEAAAAVTAAGTLHVAWVDRSGGYYDIYHIMAAPGQIMGTPVPGPLPLPNEPQGFIRAVALSPDYGNDRTILIFNDGTEAGPGGLFRSTDGGSTWSRAGPSPGGWVQALAFSPAYPTDGTIFAIGNWVWKSSDGGSSWTFIGEGLAGSDTWLRSIAISPNYGVDKTLFVGSNKGVFRSTNGGSSWQVVGSFLHYWDIDLAISPSFPQDGTIFVGVHGDGFYKSVDGGTSWSPAYGSPYLGGGGPSGLAISPSYASDSTIFIATRGQGVFKSTNGGNSWTAMNQGLASAQWVHGIAISPNFANDGTIFVATATDSSNITPDDALFRSTDGGATWAKMANIRTLSWVDSPWAVSPAYGTDRTVFVAASKGLYRSQDGGTTWLPVTRTTGPRRFELDNGIIVVFRDIALEPWFQPPSYFLTGVNPQMAAPTGYKFLGTFHEISTTESYSGEVNVIIPYGPELSNLALVNEARIRLLHWEGDRWRDVTDSDGVNLVYHTVMGTVTSLSTFAVAEGSGLPIAANDSYVTNEDTVLSVVASGVLGNDSDGDGDVLTAVLVAGPSSGSLILNSNGSFTYTPNANFNGTASFTYRAQDPGGAQSNLATVTIAVTAVNDAPLASQLAISPASPHDGDNLVANYNYFDVEGDVESGSQIRWYKNGVLQLAYNDQKILSSAATELGQQWYFTVKPKDGLNFGIIRSSAAVAISSSMPPPTSTPARRARAIPDPATWVLIVSGSALFGLYNLLSRRRKRE